MLPECLHNPSEIDAFLRRNIYLNIYSIGDLDEFFWPYTTWYAARAEQHIQALVLIYTGTSYPILLANGDGYDQNLIELVQAILPFLPARFYAHLSEGLADIFQPTYEVCSHGKHLKMALLEPERLAKIDTTRVTRFSPSDLQELNAFYAESYPDNWFDPRMLETGCYYGVRQDSAYHQNGPILSVAGIHVYSPRYGVAALGNITTHPDYRGQGLGSAATAHLCQDLLKHVDHLGLNVKADNAPAIAAYQKVGFRIVAEYEEFALEIRK